MSHHVAHEPRRVPHKPREKGAAHAVVHHERRHKTTEGRTGYVGSGATILGATLQTSGSSAAPANYYPGIVYDASGLRAYNSGGVITLQINAADGSLTVNGTGVITGGTIQTSASNPRVIMDGTGIRAYNASGSQTFNLSGADGSLSVTGTGTITGATIQTSATNPRVVLDTAGIRAYNVSSTQTVNLGSDGSFNLTAPNSSITASASGVTISSTAASGMGARVTIDASGIKGFNASNTQEFLLDATSGLISATGVITAQPGSTVPWQTTGFFVGGGNLLPNASAEDPTTTSQILYTTTGAGVTAGTFTLQYGTGTVTSSLNWNTTAAAVQTALNATGVLPTGVTATCGGGPLPGTPITVSLAGFSTPAPNVIAISSQSLIGGLAVVGQSPPGGWTTVGSQNVVDVISYSGAFHGGKVFRITAAAAGTVYVGLSSPVAYGWTLGTTRYTLSAYFRAPIASRTVALTANWYNAAGQNIYGATSTGSSWTTRSDQWQRFSYPFIVPPADTSQTITSVGGPTGGTFTLVHAGQTTSALNWNATAAQVQSALQALSSIGVGGITNAYGGPLPGTAVTVTFRSISPAPGPIALGTNSLTGGSGPNIQVANDPAVSMIPYVDIASAVAGEIFYVDAIQMEVGDVVTAFAPRPDEILANTVTANMINIGQLSAITANLGTVTAGTLTAVSISGSTITGTTINGSTIQTGTSDPRVALDSSGFWVSNSSSSKVITIDQVSGVIVTGGQTPLNSITWKNSNVSGNEIGAVYGFRNISTANQITIDVPRVGNSSPSVTSSLVEVASDSSSDTNNGITVSTYNAAATTEHLVVVIDGAGNSSFTQVGGGVANQSRMMYGGTQDITFSSSQGATVTGIAHFMGKTPTAIIATLKDATLLVNITLTCKNYTSTGFDLAAFSSGSLNTTLTVAWVAWG